jgi:hypothetical protein
LIQFQINSLLIKKKINVVQQSSIEKMDADQRSFLKPFFFIQIYPKNIGRKYQQHYEKFEIWIFKYSNLLEKKIFQNQ